MTERFDRIWDCPARHGSGRSPDLGVIESGGDRGAQWPHRLCSSRSDFSSDADAAERIDCAGRWITPGWRIVIPSGVRRKPRHEFELRLLGTKLRESARGRWRHCLDGPATRASSEAGLRGRRTAEVDALIGEA